MSSRSPTCLALLVLGLASCRGGASSSSDRASGEAPLSPQPTAPVSAATQRDLALELDATERAPDPEGALVALHQRWQGRQLTWTVLRAQALCRSATACNVVPFPAPRPADVTAHGWLPRLEFAAGQYDRLAAACGAAAQCELTFTGDLVELEGSEDVPTSLRFTNVTVVAAKTAG
jgi:hypothetical protein